MKYRICILANEDTQSHILWEKSINKSTEIEYYDIINLASDDWFELINQKTYDLFLLKPPGKTGLFKRLYDERVYLINRHLSTPIYPSPDEIYIYENKRFLRDWLIINQLPHPETHVFFNKEEAKEFINTNNHFPLVGKTNIGASGNGVLILKDRNEVLNYLQKAFETGIKPIGGPKIKKGPFIKKIKKAINNKGFLKQRLKDYKSSNLDTQYHFVILQEFVPHDYEWRCVRIGDSYFAHKKVAKQGKTSGTLIKAYDPVPKKLLNFIKETTDKTNLSSVAIDLFQKDGDYLINEIQCFFGQSDPYQMLVNGKPGRYVYKNNKWQFEEGDFNMNECFDLRLEHALSSIKNNLL